MVLSFLRRRRILAAFCVVLIGVIAPVATVAVAQAHANTGSVRTAKTTTTAINMRCADGISPAEAPVVIATLNKGQEIEGSVVATTTGGDDTAGPEDEAISIYAKGLSYLQILPVNAGRHRFEFTARTNGVEIDACWALVRFDDEAEFISPTFFTGPPFTHTATATFKVSKK